MAIGIAQFTIKNLNDITTSATAPVNPYLDQLWCDTSVTPNLLKRWNGAEWKVVNDYSADIQNLKTTTETNSTSINTIQGQISTLISNTTIIKDGVTTQLKDAYNGTVETINSMQTTIGNHESTINTQTGQINTMSSQITSIQTDLNSVRVDISNTKSDLSTTNSNVASLQVGLNGITERLAKTETEITTMTVGARNYIIASNFQDNIYKKYWELSNLYSIKPYIYNNYFYNSLICDNGGNNTWSETGQEIDSMDSNTTYTFSAMVYGSVFIQIIQVIYDANNNRNEIVVSELSIDNNKYTKYTDTFTTGDNVRYGYINIATNKDSISQIALLKLEKGTFATDWTPAPEDIDQNIEIVESNVTQTINSVSSSINQRLDSVDINVTSLQKSITTINGTLAGKADTATVTSVTNRVADLETSVNGISASITTINSTVTSNTTAINTVDTRIATAKESAISTASTDATTKSNNAIESANTYTDNKITTINTNISTMQSSITELQNSITLKVEQTDFNSTVTTINGRIDTTNSSISDMQSSINLQINGITSSVSKVREEIGNRNLIIRKNESVGYGFNWNDTGLLVENSQLSTSDFISVTPNDQYCLSIWTTTNSTMDVYWYDSNKSYIGVKNGCGWPTGEQHEILTAPSNSAYARIQYVSNVGRIKFEKGSTATTYSSAPEDGGLSNTIGTTITQSPTEVMTAFNGISNYFQVSADGAKFGNIANGDYTSMSDKGLVHHVGDTNANYMYVTYMMDYTLNIVAGDYTVTNASKSTAVYVDIDNHCQNYFIPYDSALKTLLNGRTPNFIMTVYCTQLSEPSISDWIGEQNTWRGPLLYFKTSFNFGGTANQICDANGITVRGLAGMEQDLENYSNGNYVNTTVKVRTGGTVGIRFLIFA